MSDVVFLIGTPYRDAARTQQMLAKEDFDLLDRVAKRLDIEADIVVAVPDLEFAGTKKKPTMKAIREYRGGVLEELVRCDARAVVACGPTALACLLNKGNQPLREHLRQEIPVPELDGVCCVATHSIEQVAVKPGMEKWLTLDTVAALNGQTTTEWGNYTVLQPGTPAWAKRPARLPKKLDMVGFDLETYPGLDPWHPDARIRMAVLSHRVGRAWIIQLRNNSALPAWLRKIVEDPTVTKAGSNIKYDYRWLRRFGVTMQNMFDTSTAEHVLDCTNPMTDLKSLTFIYCPRLGDYSREHRSLVTERGGWEHVTDEEQYQYCGGDGEASVAAALAQRRALRDRKLARPFRLSMDLYSVLAEMETRGACVNLEVNTELDAAFTEGMHELRDEIMEVLGPINPNSPDQLADALVKVVPNINLKKPQLQRQFSGTWYPLRKGEDPDEMTTEREVLEREAHRHPIIETILTYRRYAKLHSTYVVGLRDKHVVSHGDGRSFVHTSYRTDVVETYRLSSQGPNLQNIPRKPEPDDDHPIPLELNIKRQYVSRWAGIGGQIMEADLSQAEVRLAAHLSGDPKLIEAICSGEDLHRAMAAQALGKAPEDVTKLERTHIKKTTFLVLYGGGARTLGKQLGISKAAAGALIDQYFATYPQLARYIHKVKQDVKRTLYSESIFGYRRHFRQPANWNAWEGWRIERQAWNHKVQNPAACYTFAAMIDLEEHMRNLDLRSLIVMQVHDSILIDIYPGEEETVADLVKLHLEDAPIGRYGVDDLVVPMTADVAIGPNWGEVEEVA